MSTPCVFFDRDGIVNQRPTLDRYVRRWEEFELIPEFVDALQVVRERGYEAVIVTNQKGISTGRMTQADVDRIHHNLRGALHEHGLQLRDIMVCSAPDDDHTHRKPNPGMLIEAARRHGLDLSRSWMVGDQEKDVEAGRGAGCKTILVGPRNRPTAADHHVENMAALAALLQKVL